MSTYQPPAAAPAYAPIAAADPTAVMGRRIGGWVIDFLLYLLMMSFIGPTPLSPLAEYYRVPNGLSDPCSIVENDDDVVGCLDIGDRVYFTETADLAAQIPIWLAFVLGYVALQGATGLTPGKAAVGIKAVDQQGNRPGFGKSLVRTVLWIVDGIPCVPLVGFITGLTTQGHRRVGDMAAGTFVVGRGHHGPVVVPGLTTAGPAGYPPPGVYGVPGPQWGTPPQEPAPGQPGAWGTPPPGQQAGGWGGPPSGNRPPVGPPGSPAGGLVVTPPAEARPPFGPSSGPSGAGAATGPSSGPPSGEQRPAPPTGWTTPGGPDTTTPQDRPVSGGDTSAATGAGAEGDTAAGREPRGPATASPTPAPRSDVPPGTGAQGTGPQPSGASPQTAPSSYNPQWDPARGTYIVWEPTRGAWLGWDERAQEWRPL